MKKKYGKKGEWNMGITNLKQTDPRWATYPFCPGGILQTHGCGPVSMAMALGLSSPVEVAKWLTNHGYASSAYGTDHDGIIKGIQAYGYDCWYSGQSLNGVMVSSYFDRLVQNVNNGKVAILLMGGPGSAGGPCRTNYWCNSGHYVTACGFSNNQIKIYDPAWDQRDGYHSMYGSKNDCLNGNIKYIYLTNIPWKETVSTSYKFTISQMSEGSSGKQVKLWQLLLKSRNLYSGKIDGSFGPATKKATIQYQKQSKLVADGIAGPATLTTMIPLNHSINGTKVTFTAPQIKYGFEGGAAYFWQDLLRAYGYINYGSDFMFGSGCRKATLQYQKDHKLAQDAVVGPNTYKSAINL